MPYTVTASERTTGSGNEYETKALLYLMNFAPNCDEIDSFIVDFFNDVTGSDAHANRLWDVQSKKKRSGPNEIGAELVTLYKNYVSEWSDAFTYRMLFLSGVTNTVRKDESKKLFSYSDMKEDAKKKVRQSLIDECYSKTYILENQILDSSIDSFLTEVMFYEADQEKSAFIKPLVKVSPSLMPQDRKLEGIFNEIQHKQSAKKNTSVEGVTIALPHEVFNYCRHLKRFEIEQLILSRIVNGNPFKSSVPKSFLQIARNFPPEEERAKIEDCCLSISRQMFDKNSAAAFWQLFEAITVPLFKDSSLSVEAVYAKIKQETLNNCIHLDSLSTKYFIAVVKDGLNYDQN